MYKFLIVIAVFLNGQLAFAEDFTDLKRTALLSAASYAEPTRLAGILAKHDYQLVHQNDLPGIQLRYFLAKTADGVQYVSFRGTSNVENALVDLDLAFVPNPRLNIQLHQGFANAAATAYADMKPYLNKTQPVRTTGHSLGGAIAVIVAMHLQHDGYALERVVTFGQPKVTNVAGAQKFSDLSLTRVVTPKDLVPLVPPLSPLQLKDLDIYWHMGRELILLENKHYAVIEGIKSMMRATKFMSSVPDESNIQAHQMQTYLDLINSKLEGAELKPYAVEVKLFGISLN